MTCFETGLAALLKVELWVKWASIAAPLVTALAIFVAVRQINAAKIENKRAIAHAAYDRYLDLCFENTHFSCGYTTPSDTENDDNLKYRWFVSKMLFAFEQILDVYADDEEWINTIESQLSRHKSHLAHSSTVNGGEWSEQLKSLINKVIDSHESNAIEEVVTEAEAVPA
ncbi:hypothetical protein M3P05_19725 [Sansalvadorimonas sp. 2012CJ34-2]|uniref:Uncharacterized protein n=1 Tax=Parendozoicomonas callyspongiae TaxID=2942213 RepID=A0ABT0PL92_9GAMM|nr:hypothetical protein [Sansalvadorimonas sp. 2012CJ34-2]MCL6272154.1 hypothetical protein [Sansalvadorimonas sp. 2012CJ34-2]